ncbi:hypothetical protein K7H20_13885 [Salipiger manganoxidans]|uniref:hypothetical protein n=1 Tax=Salipiger marinus TaxID=555512 RepID=UPI001E33760B|nr:hypothetical protein [Salipiger manganoxidans]MCD1619156.1 hypothetical protein [Salipiger manganoxidans]
MTCPTLTRHAPLSTLASLMARPDPEPLLHALIAARRMGRGGSADHRTVTGHGIEGRGATWAEACHSWAEGARHLIDHPAAPAAAGLALWEQAA